MALGSVVVLMLGTVLAADELELLLMLAAELELDVALELLLMLAAELELDVALELLLMLADELELELDVALELLLMLATELDVELEEELEETLELLEDELDTDEEAALLEDEVVVEEDCDACDDALLGSVAAPPPPHAEIISENAHTHSVSATDLGRKNDCFMTHIYRVGWRQCTNRPMNRWAIPSGGRDGTTSGYLTDKYVMRVAQKLCLLWNVKWHEQLR